MAPFNYCFDGFSMIQNFLTFFAVTNPKKNQHFPPHYIRIPLYFGSLHNLPRFFRSPFWVMEPSGILSEGVGVPMPLC